jgi:homoserine kinase type II
MRAKIQKKELAELLSKYNLGRLKSIQPVETSGNNSFLITTDLGKYFLRLCGERHRHRNIAEIEGELDLLDKLRESQFPVIDYLKTKNGERVVGLGKFNGYLRKYLEGRFVTGNPTTEELIVIGQTLGKYHRIIENLNINKRAKINFGLDSTKKFFAEHKQEILQSKFSQAKKFVEVYEQEINKLNFTANLPQGMLHEDLGKRHVIWQNKEIIAIIDFDRSYFGYLVLDLGQTLRGWCFKDSWMSWSSENAGIFLQAYESVRPLSDLEKAVLVTAIKFAILERALSFCLGTIYSQAPEPDDEEFALASLFEQVKKIEI